MPLNIKDPATDRLVRELVEVTGESITDAVATSVRERLDRLVAQRRSSDLKAELESIVSRCAALPEFDHRDANDIIGYDEHGVPA